MNWLQKNGFFILLLGVISDFLTPYVLNLFYQGFNPLTMYVSALGSDDSPVRLAFNLWSIISGCLMLLGIPAVWQRYRRKTPLLALLLSLAIAFFAIGDCIFTGVFTYSAETGPLTLEMLVHNLASGAGIVGFMVVPLLLSIYFRRSHPKRSRNLLIVFFLSMILSIVSGSKDLPLINQIPVTYEGVWQRLNLFFLYLPVALLSIFEIQNRNHQKE
ncbi:DUF998 domain-containing protein [Enterococcus sp. LJL90]